MLRRSLALLVLALACATPAGAAGGRGIQLLPDDSAVAVTKDVGGERWSINLDLERGSVYGTIYRPSGDPAFVWCAVLDVVGEITNGGSIIAGCAGADRCPAPPCGIHGDQWELIGEVSIPGSFFLP